MVVYLMIEYWWKMSFSFSSKIQYLQNEAISFGSESKTFIATAEEYWENWKHQKLTYVGF